jgi:hypothetical protein
MIVPTTPQVRVRRLRLPRPLETRPLALSLTAPSVATAFNHQTNTTDALPELQMRMSPCDI